MTLLSDMLNKSNKGTPSLPKLNPLNPLDKSKGTKPTTLSSPSIGNSVESKSAGPDVNPAEIKTPDSYLQLDTKGMSIEKELADKLINNLDSVYKAVEAQTPDLHNLLKLTLENLSEQEELVYLLNPEQLAILVKGLLKFSDTQIKSTPAKRTSASLINAALKDGGQSMDDFLNSTSSLKVPEGKKLSNLMANKLGK